MPEHPNEQRLTLAHFARRSSQLSIQLDESTASLEYAMENEAALQSQVDEMKEQLDQTSNAPVSQEQDDAGVAAEMEDLKVQLNDKKLENDGLRNYLLSRVDDTLKECR